MAHERYEISLKLFIRNSKGEVLIMKPDWKPPYDRYYDIPGGRIEDSEFASPIEEILRRELVEELGEHVVVSIKSEPVATGRYQNGNEPPVFYIGFEAVLDDSSVLVPSAEFSEILWVDFGIINLEDYFVSGFLELARQYRTKIKGN